MYNEMEEQNLFLIQNMQETEEALEEIQNRARETRERMEAETDALEAQAAALRAAIAAEEDKAAEIARRGDPGKGSLAGAKPSAKKKKSDSEGKEKKPAGAIAAARGMHRNLCFTMLGTQNIENFKLYRRPHQNIHLIFLFDTAVIMIPRWDTKFSTQYE